MQDIIIHADKVSFKLAFLDAFHPSKVHIKADHWHYRYKLSMIKSSVKFKGYYTGQFWDLDGNKKIVLEKYDNDAFDEESIKYDADVKRKLILIDGKNGSLAQFSSASGGHFKVIELTEQGNIIYKKLYPELTKEFEVNINDLQFEYFEKK